MQVESVSVHNLSYATESTEILAGISFGVKTGDFVGLVGPNGSGKTTLIRMILGLSRPSSGNVLLFGMRPDLFTDWRKVGYLPQKVLYFDPYFPASVGEIVALGLLSKKRFPKRIDQSDEAAIIRALELMDILPIRDKLIGELSGGQQQRVLLARALVNEPEMIILDEPTSALDPETREKFFGILERLNQDRGVTIILVTHDIGTIGKYAARLLYLDKKVIFYGGFDDFCGSADMSSYFGEFSQHLICHRHDKSSADTR